MGFEIPWVKPTLTGREEQYVQEAIHSTWISGGPHVQKLEKLLQDYLKSTDAICVSNGTTALHLALLGAGIGAGDEVIVPNFTFVAPGNMVIAVGATPVFVDVDPATWCVAVENIRSRITSKTKAIIAVHVYGNMADMTPLRELADRHKLLLIEDAAEAFGSRYQGKYSATIGHIGTYSFHATKTLTTGEGGAVVCENAELAKKMRKIRDHGMSAKRYWHDEIGYNFRLTNFQAAFGCAQFENLDSMFSKRAAVYQNYVAALSPLKGFTLQKLTPGCEPVLWALGVQLDPVLRPTFRDEVVQKMADRCIELRPGFYPFSELPPYQKYFANKEGLQNSVALSRQMICLPFFADLTEKQVQFVVETLNQVSPEAHR